VWRKGEERRRNRDIWKGVLGLKTLFNRVKRSLKQEGKGGKGVPGGEWIEEHPETRSLASELREMFGPKPNRRLAEAGNDMGEKGNGRENKMKKGEGLPSHETRSRKV